MAEKKDYMTKTVTLAGKTVTLYSLDGNTWSSRAQELTEIQERHANQKVTFVPSRGPGPRRPAVATPVVGAEDEEVVEEVLVEEEVEVEGFVPVLPDDDDDDDEDADGVPIRGAGKAVGRKKATKEVFAELGLDDDEDDSDEDERPRGKGGKPDRPGGKIGIGVKLGGKAIAAQAAKGKSAAKGAKPPTKVAAKPSSKHASKPATKAKAKVKAAPKSKPKGKKR